MKTCFLSATPARDSPNEIPGVAKTVKLAVQWALYIHLDFRMNKDPDISYVQIYNEHSSYASKIRRFPMYICQFDITFVYSVFKILALSKCNWSQLHAQKKTTICQSMNIKMQHLSLFLKLVTRFS